MILTCSGVSDDMFGGVKRNLEMEKASLPHDFRDRKNAEIIRPMRVVAQAEGRTFCYWQYKA